MGITQLEGTTAIVTGAASGIGRATSRLLAEEGCRVIVADIDADGGAAVADEIGGEFRALDTSDPAAWDEVMEAVGGVDIAYLNAGVTTLPPGTGLSDPEGNHITQLLEQHYRRAVGVNIDGVVFGARAVVPGMIARGGGVIVATSSLAGLIGFPPDPIYAATKHAVIGLVRSLGPQLAPAGVSVHAVCPGITDTNIVADSAKDQLRAAGFPLIPPEQIAAAVLQAIRSDETGAAWVCQAGREPVRFEFRNVPGPRLADGTAPQPPETMAGNR
jgi:NAD(P)-dependent dehydrogenase (short-subunit alcohol dehydrogenase family)